MPASSELVQQKLTEFAGRARGLTTAGGIGIVSVALLMLVSIEKRFNAIWQVATPRWGVQRVLVYWGVLSLGPALLLIAVWSSIYLIGLPFLSEIRVLDVYGAALSYLPALLMFIGFTALYVVIPNSPVPLLRAIGWGADHDRFSVGVSGLHDGITVFYLRCDFQRLRRVAGIFAVAIFGVGDRAQRSCVCALVVSAR